MTERKNDNLSRSDLEAILLVNKKAVELQTEVSDQHEEIIVATKNNGHAIEQLHDKILKVQDEQKSIRSSIEEINRLQFKILLLISSGIVSLLIQVFVLLKK